MSNNGIGLSLDNKKALALRELRRIAEAKAECIRQLDDLQGDEHAAMLVIRNINYKLWRAKNHEGPTVLNRP